MVKIGLISDTHGTFDEKVKDFLKECHEIWHAGDIGSLQLADKINVFKPLRAVYGNIDDTKVRSEYPCISHFNIEDLSIVMMHIGGYPGRYYPDARKAIKKHSPDLFISGHSHILKVVRDHENNLLHMNPGACGTHGFHNVRTAIRFNIAGKTINNLEVLELPR